MPIPIGFSFSSDYANKHLCCIGCCSTGDVELGVNQLPEDLPNYGEESTSNHTSSSINDPTNASNPTVITTQPRSASSVSSPLEFLEEKLEDDALNILEGPRLGRCCAVIYDTFAPRCTAPSGCASCGCSNGACGCGSLGRLCCGIFDACFSEGIQGSQLKISAWHRHLRTKYDPMVLALAEKNSGISLQDLFIKGRGPTTREKELLEKACVEAQGFLKSVLGNKNEDSWKAEQDECLSLLEEDGWLQALEKTIYSSDIIVSGTQSFNNVLIVSKGPLDVGSCENFCIKNLGEELSKIKVCTTSGIYGVLGVSEADILAKMIAVIIFNHPSNKGIFWVHKRELRKLVCLVLGIRNLYFVDSKGNKSDLANRDRILDIRKKCLNSPHNLLLSCATSFCNDSIEDNSKNLQANLESENDENVESSVKDLKEKKEESNQKDVDVETSETSEKEIELGATGGGGYSNESFCEEEDIMF